MEESATVRAVQEVEHRNDCIAVSCSRFDHVILHKWPVVPLRYGDAAFGNQFHLKVSRSSLPFLACQDSAQRHLAGDKVPRAIAGHHSHGLPDMLKKQYRS